jgi:transposase
MTAPLEPTVVGKWTRLTGGDRESFREQVVEMYVNEGRSIRDIAVATQRSYGAIHRLLTEAKVRFRPRGNPAG